MNTYHIAFSRQDARGRGVKSVNAQGWKKAAIQAVEDVKGIAHGIRFVYVSLAHTGDWQRFSTRELRGGDNE